MRVPEVGHGPAPSTEVELMARQREPCRLAMACRDPNGVEGTPFRLRPVQEQLPWSAQSVEAAPTPGDWRPALAVAEVPRWREFALMQTQAGAAVTAS
jgi:hypothetical protein